MSERIDIFDVAAVPLRKRIWWRLTGGRVSCTYERLTIRMPRGTRGEEEKARLTRLFRSRGHSVEWDGPVVTITRRPAAGDPEERRG